MYREIIVKYVICSLHLFKTNSVCDVTFSMFYRLHDTGDAIGMGVVVSFKNQNSGYRGKFQWNFDQGKRNLVRISGEFELSE